MFKYLISVSQSKKQTRVCIPKALAKMTGFDKVSLATIESGKDGTLYIKEWKDGPTEKRGFQKN